MDGTTIGNLKLYHAQSPSGTGPAPAGFGSLTLPATVDVLELANRELIRAHAFRRSERGPASLTADWFEEIELRRYARHGAWLPTALEFGRHPGESVLLLHPGLGSDAAQYLRQGTNVTLAVTPNEHPDLIRANLERRALQARYETWDGLSLPFTDGEFDVAVWNGLHNQSADAASVVSQLYRVLKPGGKVIALFPAKYDAGYWQDIALPLQYLYWHRPPDPTTSSKTTATRLHRLFAKFEGSRVSKRHLRRSELPHLWRLWPLMLLERLLGRVLILKAFKPLSATRTATMEALRTTSLAA